MIFAQGIVGVRSSHGGTQGPEHSSAKRALGGPEKPDPATYEATMKQHCAYAVRIVLLSLSFLPFLAGCGADASKQAASS